MPKAASYANDVLDQAYNGGSTGNVVIGTGTYVLPFRAEFLTTLSTASAKGTPMSGGGYPAGGVSLSGLFTTAATAQAKSNTGAITVTNAPASTWADVEIQDSTGTPKRMNFKGTPSLAKTVNAGDTCTIPAGSLTGSET